MESSRGRIITFYSHKGGTGRSMALANVACLLSRRANVTRGVLVIDWDLEAPGLHCFFPPADFAPTISTSGSLRHDGTIELFEYLETHVRGKEEGSLDEGTVEKIVGQINLTDFVLRTKVPRVELMLAGRFDETYAERVSRFDWRHVFNRAPSLVRVLAELLASKYDYVLVDSRTGLNDISEICTALLPDQLVVVFTPNHQSLVGGLDAVKRATRYRVESEDLRPMSVFPLASRIDLSEPDLLDKWRFGDLEDQRVPVGYQEKFEEVFRGVYGLPSCDLKNYFDEIQIQHVPKYSYGEEIAALTERGARLSLSRSYAAFADVLARDEAPWTLPPSSQGGAELMAGTSPTIAKVQAAKEYISEERFRLKLYDLVARETKNVLAMTSRFGFQDNVTPSAFVERLKDYEAITNDLLLLQALVGFWGEGSHRDLLSVGPKRLCDQIGPAGGYSVWLGLRWYPAELLLYAGGIASVAGRKYENLKNLLLAPIAYPLRTVDEKPSLAHTVVEAVNDLNRNSVFTSVPGYERHYTPHNDYLHAYFQPLLEDLLYLGSDYDAAFDQFEVLYALEYAHQYSPTEGAFAFWGPVGRFGWKRPSPLDKLIAEAETDSAVWPPVVAGLFGGSYERFQKVAYGFRKTLAGLHWR